MKKPLYDKVIYISHPYQGKDSNRKEVEAIILRLLEKYPNYLFLSPVHSFGFEYKHLSYEKGIAECLWLLSQADEMWVFGDYNNSNGCKIEIEYCHKYNIPTVIFK